MSKPLVGIVMGSPSDLDKMREAEKVLTELGIASEMTIASAHRAPELAAEFARTAEDRGFKVIIAGAGAAAHLPGVIAAFTCLPVIGVPIKSSNSIDGWDSILSILQMPSGVPVATMALDAARNAGIFAAQIIATADPEVRQKMHEFKDNLRRGVEEAAAKLKSGA